MWTFIARRLISIPPLLLAVSFITYLLLYVAPGDYFTRLCDNPAITEERRTRGRRDNNNKNDDDDNNNNS